MIVNCSKTYNSNYALPGLVPGIHVLKRAWLIERRGVDGRVKPGHNDLRLYWSAFLHPNLLNRTAVARPGHDDEI